ncbi:protein tyrosine phosphatase family protein [Candidatus Obscuribacterales bacterium]|jgi:protein tyrosine/serine phosphatase|nr:protein tyrosine phosphatase family protein [Candidatus Obscuribacterales bacterium]
MLEKSQLTIKNFRVVNEWFYRGGQPDLEQLVELKDAGIKTIVCLRWNSSAIEEEQRRAEELGLRFIYLPLTYWILPKHDEIEKFFSIVDDPSHYPIFLHCKHGADRTGMLIAFYRMARDGWSADSAYAEMRDAGFHKIRMRHFKWAVYAFPRKGAHWIINRDVGPK